MTKKIQVPTIETVHASKSITGTSIYSKRNIRTGGEYAIQFFESCSRYIITYLYALYEFFSNYLLNYRF